jgi:hypothetical protein
LVKTSTFNPVSGSILKEKAATLVHELGYDNFNCSDVWLDQFKIHKIVIFRTLCGESESVTKKWLTTGCKISYHSC